MVLSNEVQISEVLGIAHPENPVGQKSRVTGFLNHPKTVGFRNKKSSALKGADDDACFLLGLGRVFLKQASPTIHSTYQ